MHLKLKIMDEWSVILFQDSWCTKEPTAWHKRTHSMTQKNPQHDTKEPTAWHKRTYSMTQKNLQHDTKEPTAWHKIFCLYLTRSDKHSPRWNLHFSKTKACNIYGQMENWLEILFNWSTSSINISLTYVVHFLHTYHEMRNLRLSARFRWGLRSS